MIGRIAGIGESDGLSRINESSGRVADAFFGPDERRELQERLERQTVPFALVTPNDKEAVWTAYPELAALVRDEYRPLVAYTSGDAQEPAVEVFLSRTVEPRGVDPATGWPCFR